MRRLRLVLLLMVCLVVVVAALGARGAVGGAAQWDFRIHYCAARAFELGLDPYDITDVNRVNGTPYPIPPGHGYPYHPYTLWYFSAFTAFPLDTATLVYLLYNVALVLLLVAVWQKFFLQEPVKILTFSICLVFAFNSSLLVALKAGNPAIFEAAVVWGALVFFVQNRPVPFLLLVSLIGFWKGTPFALAPLVLLMPGGWKNLKALFVVFGGVAAVWLSPLVLQPGVFRRFWSYASAVRETGLNNPCSFAFFTDLYPNWPLLATFVYGIWVIGLVLAFLAVARKLRWEEHRVELAFLALLTYALIVPRFKDYAYVQLLPVSYFLITRRLELLFFSLFGLFSSGVQLPDLVAKYHPFLSAVVHWGALAALLTRPADGWIPRLRPATAALASVAIATVALVSIAPSIRLFDQLLKGELRPLEISGEKVRAVRGVPRVVVDRDPDGRPLWVRGAKYAGIYAHAASELGVDLGGRYTRFEAGAGIVDAARGRGSVVFRVLGDGRELYRSRVIDGMQEPLEVGVGVAGVRSLRLIVDEGKSDEGDESAWLAPRLLR